jgi:hypothetical protein
VIFSIDHLVFVASGEQRNSIGPQLELAGFTPEQFHLEFPEIGAASDSLSFRGGGFVEFVVETDSHRSPTVWFGDIPRLMGLGFASDAFDDDTDWSSKPGGWVMDEDHVLPDGSRLNIHAAGPHQHLSDFYIFVMDRPDGALEFPTNDFGPRLLELTFTGSDAHVWRSNFQQWLNLEPDEQSLRVGEVHLHFISAAFPSVRVSPTFEVQARGGEIGLSQSALVLQEC